MLKNKKPEVKDKNINWNKWSVIINVFLTLIIIILSIWNLSQVEQSNDYNIPDQPVIIGSPDKDLPFSLGKNNFTLRIINNFDYAINAKPSVIDVTYEGESTRMNHMIPEFPEVIVKQKDEEQIIFVGEFNKKGKWEILVRTYYKYGLEEGSQKGDYEDFTLRLNIE